MKRDATRDGDPVPLFVNLVLRNAPKMDERQPRDFMLIRPSGYIKAQRYSADQNGKRWEGG